MAAMPQVPVAEAAVGGGDWHVLISRPVGCDEAGGGEQGEAGGGGASGATAVAAAATVGATPATDCEDFRRLFEDPAYRPDELKLYPCSLVEAAGLMGPWRRG